MAVRKKNTGHTPWEDDDMKYPRKRDICDVCGQLNDLKLSYDLRSFICINAHACLLRWGKQLQDT